MTSSPRRFAEDVDVVARLCRAKQRGDLEAIIEVLAPDVVWDTGPQEITARSRYAGHGGVREWLDAVAERAIEATAEPEAFRPDPSGRVAVWGTVWAQTAAGEASARRFAAMFRVQDGAVDAVRWFADAAAMLAEPESSQAAWAWLNEDPYVRQAAGSVIGRWADERALLQLEDGRVVEVPYGSAPHECYGVYEPMMDHLNAYVKQVNGDPVGGMKKYLDDHVYGPKNWNAFLSMIGIDEIVAASRRGRSIFDD